MIRWKNLKKPQMKVQGKPPKNNETEIIYQKNN